MSLKKAGTFFRIHKFFLSKLVRLEPSSVDDVSSFRLQVWSTKCDELKRKKKKKTSLSNCCLVAYLVNRIFSNLWRQGTFWLDNAVIQNRF